MFQPPVSVLFMYGNYEHSTPLKKFKRNRSGYLTRFQKGISRDASKHGRNVGTAVFVQRGSIL